MSKLNLFNRIQFSIWLLFQMTKLKPSKFGHEQGAKFFRWFLSKKFTVPLTMTFHFSFYSPVLFSFFLTNY